MQIYSKRNQHPIRQSPHMLSFHKYLLTTHPHFALSTKLSPKPHFKKRVRNLKTLSLHTEHAVAMAASTHFLSLTPKTLSLHHSNSAASAASASTLFTPSSFKPLPKLVLALSPINNYGYPTSKFIGNVAFSSELEEEVEEEETLDFAGDKEPVFSPELQVFVGNLPFSVDSAALAGLFQQAGSVEKVEVIYDKFSGRSRGFGFVTMSTVEEAEAAAQQFNGYELDGRFLRVNCGPPPAKSENSSFRGPRGQRRTISDNTNKLHVGNLAWGVDNLALETLFSEHGNVKEARVVYDKQNGRSRGFGFITYSSPEEVNNAIEVLDGADLDGRPIRVSLVEDRR